MSPSIIFWLDTLVSLATGLVALALLFLVLGANPRRRLNQAFSSFLVSVSLLGLSAGVANVALWIDTHAVAEGESFGNPLLWIQLAALGFFFVGPTLFAFAFIYVETWQRPGAGQTDQPIEDSMRRWYRVLAFVGLAVGVGSTPALFDGQFIYDIFLGQADLPRWEITDLGYVFSAAPFFFELLALRLFLKNRQRSGETAPVVSTSILLIGGMVGALLRIPFPTVSVSFAIGFMAMGYIMTRRQIFHPLQTLTGELEDTVTERTHELEQTRDKLQRLNSRQRHVAEINREIAQDAASANMVVRLAQLVHDRLGYHHVYVYLPDETNQSLIVRAAAGTTAHTVMERGHQLQIGGRSLVGQSAAQYRPRLAQAQGEDLVYFGNTALAGARAELALPLVVDNHLLGVLDIQSIYFEDLTDEDVNLMASLADQFAVTLDSARLFQKTRATLLGMEKAQQQYLRQIWRAASGSGPPACIYISGSGVSAADLSTAWSPEIAQAVDRDQARAPKRKAGDDPVTQSQTLALPIILRGQVIGALQLRHKTDRTWQPEDLEVLRNVADRLALALDNTRLQEETRRRATRDRLVGEIASQVRGSLDPDTILKTTVRELGRALGAKRAAVEIVGLEKSGDDFLTENQANQPSAE